MTPKPPRLVGHIMTRNLIVLREEDNLALAQEGLKTFSFRHLPVVEGDRLIGLVTERDLLRASISSFDDNFALRDDNLKKYFFVRELMTTDVVTVRPDTPLLQAIQAMKTRKVGCLPVTDDEGRLLGIVTQSDFASLAAELLSERELAGFPIAHPAPPGSVARHAPGDR